MRRESQEQKLFIFEANRNNELPIYLQNNFLSSKTKTMKNFAFYCICLLALSFFPVKGQDTLKSFNNRWGTELNINPLNGSFSLNNTNAQIKLRKFFPNATALRLAFTANFKMDGSKADSPYGPSPVNDEKKQSSFSFILNIGQEKHFAGTKRISPYIGYEAGVGVKFSKDFSKDQDSERTVKGAWEEIEINYPYTYSRFTERGFWSVGLNAITGIDFYLVKNFYIGCEVAFGLDYINYANVEIDDEGDTEPYPDIDEVSWKFGPKLLNGFRIGYIF
jgi:hypothetical protein